MVEPPATPLIVIVEDDELAAFLYKKVLVDHGYTVMVSRGDDESLSSLPGQRPAALLVDLHLGEIDGLDLLRRLRAQPSLRHVPAAVITGDYFTEARVSHEVEALGIELHLKPLWEEELLRVVAGLLKRSDRTSTPADDAADFRRPPSWNTVIN